MLHDLVVLEKVIKTLLPVVPSIEKVDPYTVDAKLGYAAYLLSSTQDLDMRNISYKANSLRRRAITALSNPIWSGEKAAWVHDVNVLNTSVLPDCYDRLLEMQNAAEAEEKVKKASRKVKDTKDWHSALSVIQEVITQEPKDRSPSSITLPSRPQRVDTTGNSNMLPDKVKYGIIQHSLTVIPMGKISHLTSKALSARGMMVSVIYQHYTIITNCRLIGVRNDLLPGSGSYVQDTVERVLGIMQESEPFLEDYMIVQTPRRVLRHHTYFPLLPRDGSVGMKNWDFIDAEKLGKA